MVSTARASELDTLGKVARAFARSGSARVIATAAALGLLLRVLVGAWHWSDLVVAIVVAALIGPVEWVLHRLVLHADESAWTSRRLGTGIRHRAHHEDPADLEFLLLRPIDAGVFVLLLTVGTGVLAALGGALVGHGVEAGLTGAVLAAGALLHYEWTHLLVHTRAPLCSRRLTRLARAHRLHHYRNEQYWLGVTTSVGDRLFATLPADRSAVPLSDTARTLG